MNDADEFFVRIAATIGSGEDAILFRRGLRRHVDDLTALRHRGLTWDKIARRLTGLGVRHKRGQAVSPHQLRTEYSRLRADIGSNQVDGSSRMPANPISAPPMATPPAIASAAKSAISEKLAELTRTRVRHLEIDE